MKLKILIEPNAVLRQKAEKIDPKDISGKKIQRIIKDMVETLENAESGAGLAAPQIGISLRLCVLAKNYSSDKKNPTVLVNPEIKPSSLLKKWDYEGCLSVPNICGQVKRWKKIKIEALNEKGEILKFRASDFLARLIQHEVDHLDGILFIDKAKNIKKE
ncbi:MAG: peptide deformylase [Patescibacteria group bacterium]|jgi:peptide deformylase